MKNLFRVECSYIDKCSNHGASCRNCSRNASIEKVEDKLRFNVTYVDFVSKQVIGREGEGLEA